MLGGKTIELGVLADKNVREAPARETATASLTRGLAKGSEDAFAQFYDLYSHRLFGYLFVICRGDEAQAREVLQQTFIKVARSARVFEEEKVFWNWLAAMARNLWIDESRKRNRYVGALERFWNWRAREGTLQVESAAELEVARALEGLAEEERELIRGKYLEGRSLRELAEGLGISEKAVESRLTRARCKIKELIGGRKL
jgi:RNA polymerase sigma factor (sigma-70 family)